MLATLITVWLLHSAVLVTPGANVLLVSQLAASGHRKSALFASVGIGVVAVTWAALAVLGVHAMFIAFPQVRVAFQTAGGIYLCYVAIRLWRSGSPASQGAGVSLSAWSAFRLGFLTNIMNPKSALFFGSVFAASFPPAPNSLLISCAVAMVFVNALCWHFFLAIAFSHPRVRAGYAGNRTLLNRFAGAILGAIGLRLLALSARELRA